MYVHKFAFFLLARFVKRENWKILKSSFLLLFMMKAYSRSTARASTLKMDASLSLVKNHYAILKLNTT